MNRFTTKIIPKFRALPVTDEEIFGARGYNILKYDINTARLSKQSTINLGKYSHLYISENGLNWQEIAKYKKDIWHKSAFQFGSIQFPRYETNHLNNILVYSGRSLNNIGNKTVVLVSKEKS